MAPISEDDDKGKGKSGDNDTFDEEDADDAAPKDAAADDAPAGKAGASSEDAAVDKDADAPEEEDEGYEEEPGEANAEDAGAHVAAAPKKATAKGDQSALGERSASKAIAKAAVAKPVAPPQPPPSAGLGKSVMLFILVVGGISVLMLVLGNERGASGPQPPKWAEGQSVDVDITLVSTDRQDLACASGTEIKGLHCQFESQTRRWSKGDNTDDKKMLKPYSTTNGVNFLAAGVWSDPALTEGKLPSTRFAVKCKLNVAGKMPRADVRWHEGEGWNNVTDWFAGSVSDCKLSSVQN